MPLLLECRHQISDQSFFLHFHNDYELLYVRSGAIRMRMGESRYEIHEPSLIFISRFEEHSIEILSTPYERYYAIFCAETADRLIGDMRLMSVFKNRPAGFSHLFPCGELPAAQLLFSLQQEYARPGPYSEEYAACLLRELLILTYRAYPGRFPFPERAVKNEIHEVQRYIDRHYAEPLQVSSLAAHFYIDPTYLSHRFRALTGYSPKQYIMLSRLARAKELLLSTPLPVGEIACETGFSDVNNFIRSFKKETGMTPAQYRRPQQG
ncbi:MAG: AraC family transcriptional regulator [Provencibacterium sp.]|jgi:AraC-like DNA-binding protein|nr:AraC family transcriptional regulator [Provencibacterium sp.]